MLRCMPNKWMLFWKFVPEGYEKFSKGTEYGTIFIGRNDRAGILIFGSKMVQQTCTKEI